MNMDYFLLLHIEGKHYGFGSRKSFIGWKIFRKYIHRNRNRNHKEEFGKFSCNFTSFLSKFASQIQTLILNRHETD